MRELQEIINHYNKKDPQLRCAIVCIIQVNGSSYRKPGARILLFENGEFTGSISGGCLDGDALKKAQKVIYNNKPQIVRYDTTTENESAIGLGLGCQGVIDVLIQPLNSEGYEIEQLRKISKTREPVVLVQAINSEQINRSRIYTLSEVNQVDPDSLEEAIHSGFTTRKSTLLETDSAKYSIQYYDPAIHLIICGHQYDSLVLSEISERIGWETTIYGKLQKLKYKGPITKRCIENSEPYPASDHYTASIIMSHDIDTDVRNLDKALTANSPYIGLLGPLNRRDRVFEALQEKYPLDHLIKTVHTPIGLDIGARTSEEIAIAIIAEINMYFTNSSGRSLMHLNNAG